MNRLKDRVTTDPPDSPPLSWKAKPQSSGLWLPTTLTLLLFAFPVATRLAGLQVFDESAGVVAIILFYLSGCLIAWFTWWPRLCDRRRGGPVERLEIDRAGVRLIRRRGVEEWKHDQIPGVRLFTFKGGRPSTSISVCFADPNRPRRCVRVLEADFVTPPGEIAAEMIRRFGEAVQSPAGVERRT